MKRNSKHLKHTRRASTLLEVLLAVAGIGIMCGLLIPKVQNTSELEENNNPTVVASIAFNP